MTPIVQALEPFHAPRYQPLSWTEIWQAVHDIYPNRWAIQLFPPVHDLINEAAVYHLWLLSAEWTPSPQMNFAHKYRPR